MPKACRYFHRPTGCPKGDRCHFGHNGPSKSHQQIHTQHLNTDQKRSCTTHGLSLDCALLPPPSRRRAALLPHRVLACVAQTLRKRAGPHRRDVAAPRVLRASHLYRVGWWSLARSQGLQCGRQIRPALHEQRVRVLGHRGGAACA
ncbi:hypothetical protein BC830DRAFT_81958 [Chytriomyces sp. MP71]|nr:hypothetical protein BC830DRAFT_81958 [Chytriomyces sp. MP71]